MSGSKALMTQSAEKSREEGFPTASRTIQRLPAAVQLANLLMMLLDSLSGRRG